MKSSYSGIESDKVPSENIFVYLFLRSCQLDTDNQLCLGRQIFKYVNFHPPQHVRCQHLVEFQHLWDEDVGLQINTGFIFNC